MGDRVVSDPGRFYSEGARYKPNTAWFSMGRGKTWSLPFG